VASRGEVNTPERRAAWRRAQGVPDAIEDPATLERIARILFRATQRPKRRPARSRGGAT
jgi:hypothetical protein